MQLLSAVVSLLFLIFPASPASAHNITAILNNFPEFSIFNHHLTKTHLAAKINRHNNITVCAIDNAGMTAFLSAPIPFSAMKRFLSVHVLRDYLGAEKLQQISDGTALAVPMFHSRGARKFNIIVQYDGSEVTLKTKLMDAKIIDALYDKQPLAVYKLDNILLPRELFRANIPKPEKMKIQQVSLSQNPAVSHDWPGSPSSAHLADSPCSSVSAYSPESLYLADSPDSSVYAYSPESSLYLANSPDLSAYPPESSHLANLPYLSAYSPESLYLADSPDSSVYAYSPESLYLANSPDSSAYSRESPCLAASPNLISSAISPNSPGLSSFTYPADLTYPPPPNVSVSSYPTDSPRVAICKSSRIARISFPLMCR
ncbi:hypothetical protein DCAR_0519533 [Daucus carota subsp. sativus]|uniref:FAS1 domain-containing protein n=1 Tax=Daucus carota subsp. sativus TaxID=79200 RepID=A0A161XQF0_DAUCS|nr:PREDICTED: fasciclin-like arabinogalactan protein 1 [Daucus carota subsp. sativus]WOH00175.1 hypothetical protein DCAR_0519533 [Daucus carota subsp. sativus]